MFTFIPSLIYQIKLKKKKKKKNVKWTTRNHLLFRITKFTYHPKVGVLKFTGNPISIAVYIKTGQRNTVHLLLLFGFRVQVMLRVRLRVELLFNVKNENNNNDKKLPMGLRGIEEIIVSPWQGSRKTSALENSLLAIHKFVCKFL